MRRIVIGADIVPTESNTELFESADVESLIGKELKEYLQEADFTIMNLEVPLVNELSPIRKCGPCLSASVETINGLKAINSDFYTLANNHILDQDVAGLLSTINLLEKNGIKYAGIGSTLDEAKEPYIASIGNVVVGIYCCVEHEYSLATESTPGANPFDALISFEHVRELKQRCDLVIVLYHGGKEHYRYPSPMLQRVFRKFADVGADYIIAQHTHCIGCVENYNGSVLLYGQGNFLFDHSDSEYWKTSILLQIDIDENTKQHSCTYLPCKKKENVVRVALDDVRIMEEFEKRSKEITVEGFIQKKYSEYALSVRKMYMSRLAGRFGRLLPSRILNKLTGNRFFDWMYGRWDVILPIENCIECEAHRELVVEMLRSKARMDFNES